MKKLNLWILGLALTLVSNFSFGQTVQEGLQQDRRRIGFIGAPRRSLAELGRTLYSGALGCSAPTPVLRDELD